MSFEELLAYLALEGDYLERREPHGPGKPGRIYTELGREYVESNEGTWWAPKWRWHRV